MLGPIHVLVLEVPQLVHGGATMSLDDIKAARALTQRLGIHMHLEGSRLWEAMPGYNTSLRELCRLFDSVCIDFQKGLGTIGGAMYGASPPLPLPNNQHRPHVCGNLDGQ
jgi:threonine aldolase